MNKQLTLNFNEQAYGYKAIKKILPSLGFHHCWGAWIKNDDKTCVLVFNGKKHTNISVKKNTYYFLGADTIRCKDKPLTVIVEMIKKYFYEK